MKDMRIAVRLDAETYEKCKAMAVEGNVSQWIRLLIKKELSNIEEIVIKNWKEYAIVEDIEKLEADLRNEGHLDDNGCLVLAQDGENYKKQFWQRFDVAFDDKILEAE